MSESYLKEQTEDRTLHYSEPWKLHWSPEGIDIYSSEGNVAQTYQKLPKSVETANAARIVACVNFCAGVSSEDMAEQKAAIWRDEIDVLTQQENVASEQLQQLQSRAEQAEQKLAKSEWIRVTKRLPQQDSFYLISDGRTVGSAYFYTDQKEWDTDGLITHWRELPTSPTDL